MTFRASNVVPQTAYETVRNAAMNLKLNCQTLDAQMAASGADYSRLQGIYTFLKSARDQLVALSATPGLADYAKTQEDDPAYDVVAEFTNLVAQVNAALAWMEANIPTAVTLKSVSLWQQGVSVIQTSFNPAATAPLRTALQAIVSAVS